MTVIDVHTHMLTLEWIELLRRHGGPAYEVKKTRAGQDTIHLHGAPFMTLMPAMWDYAQRIKDMDAAKVDLAIVSLTCPSAYWGGREVSLSAARMVNASMAEQQGAKPDRIRWFATIPWQHAEDAKQELARCVAQGAVGVMVLANIAGTNLTDAQFASTRCPRTRRGGRPVATPSAFSGSSPEHFPPEIKRTRLPVSVSGSTLAATIPGAGRVVA